MVKLVKDISAGTGSKMEEQQKPDSALFWNTQLQRVSKQQDRQAFRCLFDHFAPLVKAFAFNAWQADHAEKIAEELVQETMIKVWTKASSFNDKKASASTWIFTIARNTRIDILRKSARHQNHQSTEQMPLDRLETEDIWNEKVETDVFNLFIRQKNKQLLEESLQTLPAEQSEILRKVYLEDKPHSVVAEELALPLGTVKSRVRLALQKMKISIDR